MFLKSLTLKNYCGFEDYTFDFTKPNGDLYKYICFFGPNGIGKSTLLEAISLLTWTTSRYRPDQIQQRLRKYVRNEDYSLYNSLAYPKFDVGNMTITGTFTDGQEDYVVSLNENGFERNDLVPMAPKESESEDILAIASTGPWGGDFIKHNQRLIHFMSTDSDLSLNKFQLHSGYMKKFEETYTTITGYSAVCLPPAGTTILERLYCTDFTILKNKHKVHFKRMSAGERKIAKAFSQIFNLMYDLANPIPGEILLDGYPRMILLDNIEMHIYYKRHVDFINCIKDVFNKQQIFSTTHSGVLIPRFLCGENDQENELYIDLEPINC